MCLSDKVNECRIIIVVLQLTYNVSAFKADRGSPDLERHVSVSRRCTFGKQ